MSEIAVHKLFTCCLHTAVGSIGSVAHIVNVHTDIAFVAVFALLHHLDEVQIGQVFVAEIFAVSVGVVFGEHFARIDANEAAFGNVIQAADAPAALLSLESLQTQLQRMLRHAVQARFPTRASRIALVDTGNNVLHQSAILIPGVGDFTGRRTARCLLKLNKQKQKISINN